MMWTNLSNDSHDSGKIRFWDASSVALRLLLSFYVGDDQSSAEERRKTSTSTASGEVRATPQFITVFHFCPVSRILVLGCLSGSIFFYKFTYSPPNHALAWLAAPTRSLSRAGASHASMSALSIAHRSLGEVRLRSSQPTPLRPDPKALRRLRPPPNHPRRRSRLQKSRQPGIPSPRPFPPSLRHLSHRWEPRHSPKCRLRCLRCPWCPPTRRRPRPPSRSLPRRSSSSRRPGHRRSRLLRRRP